MYFYDSGPVGTNTFHVYKRNSFGGLSFKYFSQQFFENCTSSDKVLLDFRKLFLDILVSLNYFCHWLQMLKLFRASFLYRFWCNLKMNLRRRILKMEISRRYRILSSSFFASLQWQWYVTRFWVSLSKSLIFFQDIFMKI